jgi:hypothetical protein
VSTEAFDSKGRYFYAKNLKRDFEYYVNKDEEWELKVIYCDYEEIICIEIHGDRWGEYDTLNEDKNSPYHLQSINEEIQEKEKKLCELKDKRLRIAKFYDGFNLL